MQMESLSLEEEVIGVDWEQKPQRARWQRKPSDTPQRPQRAHKEGARADAIRTASAPAATPTGAWEYLDHTADVQIHAWGRSVSDAFASTVVGMFGYMVSLEEIGDDLEMSVEAEGHDWESLLFNFMDECLYAFHAESFVMKEVRISVLNANDFRIRAVARGGLFDVTKHSQGTEVKAITYSNMKIIRDNPEKADVFVIVDI